MKYLLILTFLFSNIVFAQTDSLDLKIGQMVMVGLDAKGKMKADDPLLRDLKAGKIGGIVMFEKNLTPTNSAAELKALNRQLQENVQIPLFIGIDEEGGRVHRLKKKYGFFDVPSAKALGKLNVDDSTRFHMFRLSGLLKELGFNLNFAPTVDLAVNPDNPVIAKMERSYSDDPEIVAKHAAITVEQSRKNGIITVLKHFPGHGSSANDSHWGMVDVSSSWNFLELMPYAQLAKTGMVDAVMTAHIINNHLDDTAVPATLSEKVVTDLLRNVLLYDGVVFSDDMQMHAISEHYGFENAIKMAIDAGVDVLLFANNVSGSQKKSATQIHDLVKQLVLEGKITEERIDESYRRIMALKGSYILPAATEKTGLMN